MDLETKVDRLRETLERLEGKVASVEGKIDAILLSHQNPKVLVCYDAEIVSDLLAEFLPVFGDGFTKEA